MAVTAHEVIHFDIRVRIDECYDGLQSAVSRKIREMKPVSRLYAHGRPHSRQSVNYEMHVFAALTTLIYILIMLQMHM